MAYCQHPQQPSAAKCDSIRLSCLLWCCFAGSPAEEEEEEYATAAIFAEEEGGAAAESEAEEEEERAEEQSNSLASVHDMADVTCCLCRAFCAAYVTRHPGSNISAKILDETIPQASCLDEIFCMASNAY